MEPKKFFPLLAGAGSFVLVHQLLDMVPVLAGIDLATPTGRVRLVMMVWTRSAALAVADVMLVLAAFQLGRSAAMVALGRIHQLVGTGLLLAVPFLLVSAGGMASSVGGNSVVVFQATVARALVGLGLAGVGFLIAGKALPRVLTA